MEEQIDKTIGTTFYRLMSKKNVEFYLDINIFLN